MPVLSQSGVLYTGYGGTTAYKNGVQIGPGAMGVWCPVTDDVGVGQVCQASCGLFDTNLTLLNAVGVNQITAGGGRWASFTNFTLTDSARGTIANEYPLACDELGWLATQNYLSDTPVTLTRKDGFQTAVLSIHVATVIGANFRSGIFAVSEANIGWSLFDVYGARIPYLQRASISQCIVVMIDNAVHLLEQDNNLLVTLRPANSWIASIVSQGALAFHQDCRFINGLVRVVWSSSQGEEPGTIADRSYTLAQIQALPTIDTSQPVQPPVPPVTPPSTTNDLYLPVPLSAMPPARCGCTDGTPEMGRRPGSAYWSPTSTDDMNLPVGEGAPYENTMTGRTWLCVKFSTEKAAAGTLDASIALAKRLGRPLEIHHDDVHDPAQIDIALDAYDKAKAAGVVPILQAHAVENVADFEHAARAFYAKDHRFNICVNLQVLGKDPEKFRAVVQKAEQLHRELRPVTIWFTRWRGAGPLMKNYVAEYCRLTPTP
jgi:hypothetical protein